MPKFANRLLVTRNNNDLWISNISKQLSALVRDREDERECVVELTVKNQRIMYTYTQGIFIWIQSDTHTPTRNTVTLTHTHTKTLFDQQRRVCYRNDVPTYHLKRIYRGRASISRDPITRTERDRRIFLSVFVLLSFSSSRVLHSAMSQLAGESLT